MKFGLSDECYKILEETVFIPLWKKNAQVFVFGSRARGTQQPFSDIDILYVDDTKTPLDPIEISQIKEDAENSNLPIKVDLVNDKDLARSYRDSVEKDKKRVSKRF